MLILGQKFCFLGPTIFKGAVLKLQLQKHLIIFFSTGFSGKKCECDISKIGVSSFEEHTKKCRQNKDSEEICNNNGECECGKCKCDSDHVGKFCACDKDECPK